MIHPFSLIEQKELERHVERARYVLMLERPAVYGEQSMGSVDLVKSALELLTAVEVSGKSPVEVVELLSEQMGGADGQ